MAPARGGGRSSRHVFTCVVLPSVLLGIAIGSYGRSIHQLAVFLPGSVGVLSNKDAPITALGVGLFASSSSSPSSSNSTSATLGQDRASTQSYGTALGAKDDHYQSPVESMIPRFPNGIVEKEVVKHDRLVVESLAFVNSFKGGKKYLDLIQQRKQSNKSNSVSVSGHLRNKQLQVPSRTTSVPSPEPLTVVFLTVNRAVPYIAVALASLIRGHTPETFVERLSVHVCNLEKRKDRIQTFHLFDTLKERFPFITFHSWNEKYPELKSVRGYNVFMEEQRRDYVKALKICKEAAGPWCQIYEDDTLFPARFAQKFDKIISAKDVLESAGLGGSRKTIEIPISKLLMVKLYNPYNDPLSKERNIYSEMYGQEAYNSDRAITAMEARDEGKAPEETKYSFQISLSGYGIVSNAYPLSSVEPLIQYLETNKFQVGHPTDTSINFSFPMKSKKKVMEVTPSLVNHIGFYSENQDYKGQGATLSKSISTDVRFNIDDGHRR